MKKRLILPKNARRQFVRMRLWEALMVCWRMSLLTQRCVESVVLPTLAGVCMHAGAVATQLVIKLLFMDEAGTAGVAGAVAGALGARCVPHQIQIATRNVTLLSWSVQSLKAVLKKSCRQTEQSRRVMMLSLALQMLMMHQQMIGVMMIMELMCGSSQQLRNVLQGISVLTVAGFTACQHRAVPNRCDFSINVGRGRPQSCNLNQ